MTKRGENDIISRLKNENHSHFRTCGRARISAIFKPLLLQTRKTYATSESKCLNYLRRTPVQLNFKQKRLASFACRAWWKNGERCRKNLYIFFVKHIEARHGIKQKTIACLHKEANLLICRRKVCRCNTAFWYPPKDSERDKFCEFLKGIKPLS